MPGDELLERRVLAGVRRAIALCELAGGVLRQRSPRVGPRNCRGERASLVTILRAPLAVRVPASRAAVTYAGCVRRLLPGALGAAGRGRRKPQRHGANL